MLSVEDMDRRVFRCVAAVLAMFIAALAALGNLAAAAQRHSPPRAFARR